MCFHRRVYILNKIRGPFLQAIHFSSFLCFFSPETETALSLQVCPLERFHNVDTCPAVTVLLLAPPVKPNHSHNLTNQSTLFSHSHHLSSQIILTFSPTNQLYSHANCAKPNHSHPHPKRNHSELLSHSNLMLHGCSGSSSKRSSSPDSKKSSP